MKKNGYTLIEILVALMIIALLFTGGFAAYRDFSRRQVLAGAAKLVKGDLVKAQQNALSGIKPNGCTTLLGYLFYVDPSGTYYNIQANCSSGNVVIGSNIYVDNSLVLSVPSPNPIQFKVLGQGTNLGGTNWTLTVTQGLTSNQATVSVSSGGEISVVTLSGTGTAPTPGATPTPSPTPASYYGCINRVCTKLTGPPYCTPNYTTSNCGGFFSCFFAANCQ